MTTTEKGVDKGEAADQLPAPVVDPADQLAALYEHAKGLTVDDPAEVKERILRSVLAAASVHDLLAAGAAVPAEQLYNVPLSFERIRASESTFVDGPDLYLHVECRIVANGDAVTISCGARDVVTKLLAADMRGWLPFTAVMEQSAKPTKDGFYPVFLRPVVAEPF